MKSKDSLTAHWVVKTEPDVYSFQDLQRDGRTYWNGVRNFQARKNLTNMKVGDLVLVYHSQGPKSVVGIARVVKEAYADTHVKPDDPKGDWVMVDLEPVKPFSKEVTLTQIKALNSLAGIALVRQARLSVMPLLANEFAELLKLGQTKL